MTAGITVLKTSQGEILTKRIGPNGIRAYDSATYFDQFKVPAESLLDLGKLLIKLQVRPCCAVIRGEPLLAARTTLRRLSRPQEGYAATFGPASRRWLAIDVDGSPRPEGVAASDLEACGQAARALLPREFHDAACVVQATASHGIKPGSRLRIWVWLTRPVSDGEAKRWLPRPAADPALYTPVALHYTAAPVFCDGMTDHLPKRLAYLPGEDMVQVPAPDALAPPPPTERPLPTFSSVEASAGYTRQEMTWAVGMIRSAEIGSRHRAMVRGAGRTAWLVQAGWLAEGVWRSILKAAVQDAAPDAAPENIASALDWALATPAPGAEFDHVQR